MLASQVLAAAVALAVSTAAPTGEARVRQGADVVPLHLVSFETSRVQLPGRGMATSAEALFLATDGDRLDLRIAYRGPGPVPARRIATLELRLSSGGRRTYVGGPDGCRVVLTRATAREVAGRATCRHPAIGAPLTIAFVARQ